MKEKTCGECQHYLRHYTFDSRRIFRVYCGHCRFGKPRRKQPDAKACENFKPGQGQEQAFASKEYLSKELLKYLLSLELMPEIEEGE